MADYIRINPADNVAVALSPLAAGTEITPDGHTLRLCDAIPAGHKFALKDISVGENIIKYGFPISHAVKDIPAGGLADHHNVATNLSGISDYVYTPATEPSRYSDEHLSFMGYLRASGEAGVRNEIWIIPTVGCVNGIAEELARRLREETGGQGVDAILAYTHNYGCSQLGDDHENTRRILRDMVVHPNAGAVLVVGLGCENNQPAAFREMLGQYDTSRIRFLESQQSEDEIAEGMRQLREMYAIASSDKREPLPLSMLRIGLKCGGSDGLSGITANPLLGEFSDWLVAQGGTTVLTEVPEMFGAEILLMNRCRTKEQFRKTVAMINGFKQYFINAGQPIYENPSPGNKAGGISTLEEKSLGCTQKSGTSPVEDVLEYGARLEKRGLNLLCAPGNDLVASTALAAAGCQIVLFTTGRGTPFGTFVPTLKISTNTPLYSRKPRWIDFNAGTLAEEETMPGLARKFFEFVIDTANGRESLNERNGYREIAILKQGVTL